MHPPGRHRQALVVGRPCQQSHRIRHGRFTALRWLAVAQRNRRRRKCDHRHRNRGRAGGRRGDGGGGRRSTRCPVRHADDQPCRHRRRCVPAWRNHDQPRRHGQLPHRVPRAPDRDRRQHRIGQPAIGAGRYRRVDLCRVQPQPAGLDAPAPAIFAIRDDPRRRLPSRQRIPRRHRHTPAHPLRRGRRQAARQHGTARALSRGPARRRRRRSHLAMG